MCIRDSSTLVVCTSPVFVAGMSSVEVVTLTDVPSVNRLEYLYHSAIVVDSLLPSEGSEDELHVVLVVGRSFIAGQLRCQVGGSGSIEARWHSSSIVECGVPARTGPATVPIEVSNNGVEYSQSGREFRYVERSALSGLAPSVGPVRGGTAVNATGQWAVNITEPVWCRFGQQRVQGEALVGGRVIGCRVPEAEKEGRVSVSVTFGTASAKLTSVSYTHLTLPTIYSV